MVASQAAAEAFFKALFWTGNSRAYLAIDVIIVAGIIPAEMVLLGVDTATVAALTTLVTGLDGAEAL